MRISALLVLFLTAASALSAQTLTTNSEGKQIIVYPDGSWRYFDQTGEAKPAPVSTPSAASANPIDPVAEAKARAVVRKQLKKQQKAVRKHEKAFAKTQQRELKALSKLNKLKRKGDALEREQLELANRKYQDAKLNTEQAQVELADAVSMADILQRAIPMTRSRRQDFFVQNGLIERSEGLAASNENIDIFSEQTTTNDAALARGTQGFSEPTRGVATYNSNNDPRINPPQPECEIAEEGVDAFTQKRRRNLAPSQFFAYTTPELKPYLGDNSLITAMGTLSRNGSALIFEVDYTIRSQYANREFGVLPRGSALTMRMIDGSTVVLENYMLTQGVYDPIDKVYTYNARYPISRSQEKTLSRELLDQVRVMWGTGFEDYPIFEIDYFKRQISCL